MSIFGKRTRRRQRWIARPLVIRICCAAAVAVTVAAQGRPRLVAQGPPSTTTPTPGEWPYIGGDAAQTRYAPLDQINASNFEKLEIAWTWRGDNFGASIDTIFRSTPIYVDGVLNVSLK